MNRITFIFVTFVIMCPGMENAIAAVTDCDDEACFIEQAADCKKNTRFLTAKFAGAQVRYSIMGAYKGRCDIRMVYTQHPDPEWVDLSMGFVIDPEGDIDMQIKSAVAGCLGGDDAQWLCGGSLFDMVTGAGDETAEVFAEPVAAASPPCGVEVVDDGPPLYPMPQDGKWGYVTRDGEWAIEPRWIQAEPFSEGRAAVSKDGLWGIIDRQGEYVLGPVLRSPIIGSPLLPFSQGCATANIQKDGFPHAFFVSRDGRYWFHDERPSELADRRIWSFGRFSSGRAWFQVVAKDLTNSYGWIDSQGKVVLQDNFSGAGDFVNGKAPAAKGGRGEGFYAYIDLEGNPVIPSKWKFYSAKPFSEGLAAARSNKHYYFDMKGAIVIDRVKLKVSREFNGKMLTEVEISEAGNFHDSLAPIRPDWISYDEPLIYIRPDGTEAFAPTSELGVVVCWNSRLAEFRDGLVQLLVADKGEACNGLDEANDLIKAGKARYVYLDSSGNIVLQQKDKQ